MVISTYAVVVVVVVVVVAAAAAWNWMMIFLEASVYASTCNSGNGKRK